MNKNLKQSLIGILIGAIFLFLTLRNKPFASIWESISKSDLGWIGLNGLLLITVFILRGLRWKVLLENTGEHPKRNNVIYSLIMGYFVNSFTPKLGEVIRCTSLSKNSKIPLPKSFGSVVIERIWDILILGTGLIIISLIEIDRLGGILILIGQYIGSLISGSYLILIAFIIAIAAVIGLSYKFVLRSAFAKKIEAFIIEIIQTVKMTFKIKHYKKFLLLTSLIWISLILMNYTALKALPEMGNYTLYFATVILFVGGIGWALPSPGGIGTTHFFILQIFIVFGLQENAGIAYGILSNGLTFVFTLIIGLLAIGFQTFIKQKQ
ncbi:MAG: flippase-like domain-containing protein [Bacteroidales bacterium]|nr:flippase-like domain-containing protein [Bacteroidales bacterium]